MGRCTQVGVAGITQRPYIKETVHSALNLRCLSGHTLYPRY